MVKATKFSPQRSYGPNIALYEKEPPMNANRLEWERFANRSYRKSRIAALS